MKRVVTSAAAFAVVAVALAAGAAEKFVIALPNGYEMGRTRAGAPAIMKKRGSVVVPGPIKSYTVLREVVVGELDVPGANASTAPPTAESPAPAAESPAPTAPASAAPPATAAPAASPSAGAPPAANSAPAASTAGTEPAAAPPGGGAAPGAQAPAAGAAPGQGGGMQRPAGGAPGGRPRAGGGAPPGGSGTAPGGAAASPVFTRPPPPPDGRYFVLDTKTGEVGKDLSLSEWEARLKKYDITTAPALAAPILPK